ncbi:MULTISPECIES: glycosyltransferase [Thermodesulfovibrio]|uniref:glycosyltransferase n=1 Tax=Thermodesulfovibrio yellowstonii TaxID=28262 RepID=UPI0003F5C89F|nr:glycosyltransferase [Thermodesulfovibrio islandicus]
MNILIVTDQYPIPPKDGRYIPIFELIKFLGKKYNVDLLILLNDKEKKELCHNKTEFLKNLYIISTQHKNKFLSFIKELLIIEPMFLNLRINNIGKMINIITKNNYDVVWISPIYLSGIIKYFKLFKIDAVYCLGLNDSIYYSYFKQGLITLIGKTRFNLNHFIRLFRIPFVFLNERKLLKHFDLIHLQTFVEKKREMKLFCCMNQKPTIVVAPNGKNEKLVDLSYKGYNYKKVLLMNHLDKNKKNECVYFIENIWPYIKRKHKDSELHVIGLPPPAKLKNYLESFEGVKIRGFLENIEECYSGMTLSVIYTHQDYGIINRLLDSMSAGLPVVISSSVFKTIRDFGFIEDVHGIVVKNDNHLVNTINTLLSEKSRLIELSRNSRNFMKNNFNWLDSLREIENAIINIKNKKHEIY